MFHRLSISLSEKYILEPAKNYTFLSQNDMTVGAFDDAEEFDATMQALRIMGVAEEDLDSIWKVVSGVMLFGNMEFKQESRNSDQAVLADDTVAQKVCSLKYFEHSVSLQGGLAPTLDSGPM